VPSYTVGYIDVYRNGVRLVSTDFTATTGTTVVLVNACTSGDAVVTESFYVSSVLNAIPATAGSVSSSYLAGGAALSNIGSGGVTQTYIATGVAGTGPAFSAYLASNQSIPNNTITKITINTEIFDTASAYDNATNYRFTPLVAGYYQIIGAVADVSGGTTGGLRAHLYKNGAAYTYVNIPMTNTGVIAQCSAIISFNGTTDYVELYGSQNSGGALNIGGGATVGTMLSGCLVRSA
jgi:hypothetical protein